jgi:hypothetical protein
VRINFFRGIVVYGLRVALFIADGWRRGKFILARRFNLETAKGGGGCRRKVWI